jgi:excisionase family DNA binding protein
VQNRPDAEKLTVRVETAAKMTELSVSTLWRAIARGDLKVVRIARTTRIRVEDLRAFLDAHVQ